MAYPSHRPVLRAFEGRYGLDIAHAMEAAGGE
jgi:hypothetical protein